MSDPAIAACRDQVATLLSEARALAEHYAPQLHAIAAPYRPGAANLVHYLAIRRHDIRHLQMRLAAMGLSSLGRMEADVEGTLIAVLGALDSLAGAPSKTQLRAAESTQSVDNLGLSAQAALVFGPPAAHRRTSIMVTLPSQAATDPAWAKDFVASGAQVARINCAHDGPKQWIAMAAHIRAAAAEAGAHCKILMDLCGPKIRTAALSPGPRTLRIKVKRGSGPMRRPVIAALFAPGSRANAERRAPHAIPVDQLGRLAAGQILQLTDLRGKERTLVVREVRKSVVLVEIPRTVVLIAGLTLIPSEGAGPPLVVGELPQTRATLLLAAGDVLRLAGPDCLGQPAQVDAQPPTPASVGCTLPEVLPALQLGQRVLFDDGKVHARVERAMGDSGDVLLRITRGGKIRQNKGINTPETQLDIPALAPADLRALDVVVEHADIVGLSFARDPADVAQLHRELAARTRREMGTILKIETARGFAQLPDLLLAGLQRPPLGVMVARGDLAVEVGFDRMAEVQEEILWLCEAARVPVIWATEVLQQLTKTGIPTRAEVTDAAMSGQAECVMLNKGPFVFDSVRFLDNVLRRMEDHHHKKTPMLRRLKVSEGQWRG
ncbi:MAG: hypothetical protein KC502_12120 [Myxococcales bacterium]|nr:hypothetical protein [Myxococcales bacterium]